MAKILTLLLIFLLMLGSLSGYLILTNKITAGNLKIAAGEIQIAEGERMLANGKSRLASGQQRLNQANNTNNQVKSVQLVTAVLLPISLVGSVASGTIIDRKISQGSQQIARGKQKVKAGEKQLEAGKLELRKGKQQLSKANVIRTACAIASIFFAALFLLLGFCWRKTFIKK